MLEEKSDNTLGSLLRFLQTQIDMSAGVLETSNVYPPELNNRANNVNNIDSRVVTPSGDTFNVSTNQVSAFEFMKLNNYIRTQLNPSLVESVGYTMNNVWTHGYNELNPSDNTLFGTNSAVNNLTVFGETQNVANSTGSQANCDGQYVINAMFLNGTSPLALNRFAPILTDSSGAWDFSYILLNDDGEKAPDLIGASFEHVDNEGVTAIDRLLKWAGVVDGSGEVDLDPTSDDISFSKLQNNVLMQNRLKFMLTMYKIYKIERACQYGLMKLPLSYIAELLSTKNLTGLDVSGSLKTNQFPNLEYAHDAIKAFVSDALALDPSLNIENVQRRLFNAFPPDVFFNPLDMSGLAPVNLDGTLRIYYFHVMALIAMSHNNDLNQTQIDFFKNHTIPNWDLQGNPVDVSFGIDFTKHDSLPAPLAGVPVFEDLYYKMKNTFVINNGIHLGNSNVSVVDTPMGHAVLNMYKHLYQNLVDNASDSSVNPLLSLNQFTNVCLMSEFLSCIAYDRNAYRSKVPGVGGAFSAPVLTRLQCDYLAKTSNAINYKLLKEFVERSGNDKYAFNYGIWITGSSGKLSDFEEAAAKEDSNFSLPADNDCPCL